MQLPIVSTPKERLTVGLAALKRLQDRGLQAIPGPELSRSDREALLRAGFLKEVIRGWYIPTRRDEAESDTTAWYASMREFVAGYGNKRFGDEWHVNPEQSLLFRSGERTAPKQLQIWAPRGYNQTVSLLHGCSVFIYRAPKLLPASPVAECGGLRLVELPSALVNASPTVFIQNPIAGQIALASLPDASDLLRFLLDGPHPSVAGRLAAALRAVNRPALADEIVGAMTSAGYVVNEVNPFGRPLPSVLPGGRPESPSVQRVRLMWAEMREAAIRTFPERPTPARDVEDLLKDVEARYVTDASPITRCLSRVTASRQL